MNATHGRASMTSDEAQRVLNWFSEQPFADKLQLLKDLIPIARQDARYQADAEHELRLAFAKHVGIAELAPRQLRCLLLASLGLDARQISQRLGLRKEFIETNLSMAILDLGACDLKQALTLLKRGKRAA